MNIEVTYKVKWRLKDNPKYCWSECKKLINCHTGTEIKRTIKSMQAGYWIDRKFVKLCDMKSKVELIPKNEIPF